MTAKVVLTIIVLQMFVCWPGKPSVLGIYS